MQTHRWRGTAATWAPDGRLSSLTLQRPDRTPFSCGFSFGAVIRLYSAARAHRPVALGLDLNEYDLITFHAARYTTKTARPGIDGKTAFILSL